MVAPTVSQVDLYCRKRGLRLVDPARFVAFHEQRGWSVKGKPMRNWHRACLTWQRRAEGDRPIEITMGKSEDSIPPLFAEILRLTHTAGKGWPYDR